MTGKLIFVNGTINSGKSTIGRLLAETLPSGVYVDGDEVIDQQGLSLEQWILKTIQAVSVQRCVLAKQGKNICISYPLRDEDWKAICLICEKHRVKPTVITLAPKISTALSNRGDRNLTDEERSRISQMYDEGYHTRSFSDLIVENDLKEPAQTVQEIIVFIESI